MSGLQQLDVIMYWSSECTPTHEAVFFYLRPLGMVPRILHFKVQLLMPYWPNSITNVEKWCPQVRTTVDELSVELEREMHEPVPFEVDVRIGMHRGKY